MQLKRGQHSYETRHLFCVGFDGVHHGGVVGRLRRWRRRGRWGPSRAVPASCGNRRRRWWCARASCGNDASRF